MEAPPNLLDDVRAILRVVRPTYIRPVSYCENPHQQYITEEHCPPKRAPEIPRRDF